MFKLFDLHCDTAANLLDYNFSLSYNTGCIDLEQAAGFSAGYAQVFALWGDGTIHEMPARFDNMLRRLKSEIDLNSDRISLCRNYSEVIETIDKGRTAALIMIEGAEMIGCDPDRLRAAHEQGVIMSGITWNYDNALGYSAAGGLEHGLTPRGREYAETARELRMIIDSSHLNEAGFWDLAEIIGKRMIASHSNSKKVCGHFRNLTDEQFLCLCEMDSLVGLNLCADFISENECTIDHLIAHIDHFMALGGENALCLGCDLDGCDTLPDGIRRLRDIEKIYNRLLQINYNEDTLRDLFFNNAAHYFKSIGV